MSKIFVSKSSPGDRSRYACDGRAKQYEQPLWGVLTYLALFAIVLFHEFGHALACRQVGGIANRIILWPLCGIAFVNPPRRPGAYLGSIAAGPLVNVALIPIIGAAFTAALHQHALGGSRDSLVFWAQLRFINYGLLIFNLLPIFPLDGGQIVRGRAALARADELGRGRGPYAVQAAIAECHAIATSTDETDWERIVLLYEALGRIAPNPVVELNRAAAVSMATGPANALWIADELAAQGALQGSHLLPSVRGELLARLGRTDEAVSELTAAAGLAANDRERDVLLAKAARLRNL